MKKKLLLIFSIVLLLILTSAGMAYYTASQLPEITKLNTCFVGNMNNVSVCPRSSEYVKLNNVSNTFLDALVVSEDAAFWHHEGIDWFEIKESIKRNLEKGGFARGGSTISQQLIKNAFLSPEKSLTRKLKEVMLTHQLESKYSKEFILEKYVNIVEFGPNLFGLKAAAQYYFYKAPSQLNVLESAYLVHLLPNPKMYSKTFENSELTDFSKRMITIISKRLLHYKKISPEQYKYVELNLGRFPWYGIAEQPFESEMEETMATDPLESAEELRDLPVERTNGMDELGEVQSENAENLDEISTDSLELKDNPEFEDTSF